MGEKLKTRIMFVDDNHITCRLMKGYLSGNGFDEVIIASGGLDCLEKLSNLYKEGKFVDCAVIDSMMPQLDGYHVIEIIRQGYDYPEIPRDIPLILISALNDVSNQIKTVEVGADFFVSKPIEEKLLVRTVEILLYKSRLTMIKRITESFKDESDFYEKIKAIVNF